MGRGRKKIAEPIALKQFGADIIRLTSQNGRDMVRLCSSQTPFCTKQERARRPKSGPSRAAKGLSLVFSISKYKAERQ